MPPRVVSLGTQPGSVMVEANDGSLIELSNEDAVAQGLFDQTPVGDGVGLSAAESASVQPPGDVQGLALQQQASGAGIADALAMGVPAQAQEQPLLADASQAAARQRAFSGQPLTAEDQAALGVPSQAPEFTTVTMPQPDTTPPVPVPGEGPTTFDLNVDRTRSEAAAEASAARQTAETAARGEFANGLVSVLTENEARLTNGQQQIAQSIMAYLQGGGRNPGVLRNLRQQLSAEFARGGINSAALDANFDAYIENLREGGDIQSEGFENQEAMFDYMSAWDRSLNERRALHEMQINQKIEAEQADLEGMYEEARNVRLDPNRIFAGRTPARMSAAISAGVGAALQTTQSIMFPGSNPQNTALTIINTAIERDINAQVENYRRGTVEADQQAGIVNLMRSRLGDNQASYEAARTAMTGQVINQLRSIASSTSSQTVRNQIEQVILGLEQQRLNARAAASAASADAIRQQMRRSGGRRVTFEQLIAGANSLRQMGATAGAQAGGLVERQEAAAGAGATAGPLVSQEDATSAQQALSTYVLPMRQLLRRLESTPVTDIAARRVIADQGQRLADLALQGSTSLGSGFSDMDRELIQQGFPNPVGFWEQMTEGDWLGAPSLEALNLIQRQLEAKAQGQLSGGVEGGGGAGQFSTIQSGGQ